MRIEKLNRLSDILEESVAKQEIRSEERRVGKEC